MEGLSPIGGAN